MNNTEYLYKKNVEDELGWKMLDQLHGAVSKTSSFCSDTKRFCVTTTFIVLTLLAKFTADRVDHSLFVTGIVIPILFWFPDSKGHKE